MGEKSKDMILTLGRHRTQSEQTVLFVDALLP